MNDKEQLREIKQILERMSDKEKIQVIKDYVRFLTSRGELGPAGQEYFKWLIEQAEKVEQLQLEKDFFKGEWKEIQEKYLRFLEQFHQAQEKIERCKEILKDIREASSDIFALRKAEQALQALEEVE